MVRQFIFILTALVFAIGSRGSAEPTAPYKFAMEIELSSEHFSKIINFFDLDALQTSYRSIDPVLRDFNFNALAREYPLILDSYLRDSPSTLNEIPAELRAELTSGLQLNSLIKREETKIVKPPGSLDLPSPPISKSGLLGADGRPLAAPVLKLNPLKIIESGTASSPSNFEKQKEEKGILRPERLDWEELNKRWAELPFDEKYRLVKWEKLGADKKAELVLVLKSDLAHELKLKADAPERIKKVFGKLRWAQDGTMLEFKHATTVSSIQELKEDIRDLARLTGVERKIFFPEDTKLKGVNLHYHVSQEGADFYPYLQKLNRYIAAQRIHAGIVNDLTGGEHIYRKDIHERGLIRRVSRARFEVRAHVAPLAEELDFFKKTLDAGPDGLRMLDAATKELLNEETLDRIFRHDRVFVRNYEDLLSPVTLKRFYSRSDRYRALEDQLLRGDAAAWRRIPSLLRSTDGRLRNTAIGAISESHWPRSFLIDLPAIFARGDSAMIVEAVRLSRGEYIQDIGRTLINEALRKRPQTRDRVVKQLLSLEWDATVATNAETLLLDSHMSEQELLRGLNRYLDSKLKINPTFLEAILPRLETSVQYGISKRVLADSPGDKAIANVVIDWTSKFALKPSEANELSKLISAGSPDLIRPSPLKCIGRALDQLIQSSGSLVRSR